MDTERRTNLLREADPPARRLAAVTARRPLPTPEPMRERTWATNEPWLSLRELDVLDLVASGYSDKEIAARIGVSAATVNTHLRHVYAKLHAHNRAHAVAIAVRRGFLKLRSGT